MLASTMQSRCESGKDQAQETQQGVKKECSYSHNRVYTGGGVFHPIQSTNLCIFQTAAIQVRAAGVAVTPFLSILGCLISRCSQDIRNRNVSFSNLKFCTQKSFCLLRAKWAFQVQLGGKILMYTLVLSPCHWLHDLKLELEMKAFFRVAGSSVQTKLEKIRAIMENLP